MCLQKCIQFINQVEINWFVSMIVQYDLSTNILCKSSPVNVFNK